MLVQKKLTRENVNKLIQEAEEVVARGEQGTLHKITKKISAKYNSGSTVARDLVG